MEFPTSSHSDNAQAGQIVIPVHNALAQTSRCLESVVRFSPESLRIILVNDASDSYTSDFLRQFARKRSNVTLIENETNQGFLHSANTGLAAAEQGEPSGFVILLNSDTIVTAGWYDAFVRCFASDRRIGLATPVSNNAVNLSVAIPAGENLFGFAEKVARAGRSLEYSDITTAIGFCMAIRVAVLEEVGGFDTVFAPGYGEDTDYHFRTIAKAYRSVLVPDCFIYHESHASFSTRKAELVARNRPVFDRRWSLIYRNELERHDAARPIERLTQSLAKQEQEEPLHEVLFILPTATLCGGVIVIYELVNRLVERGIKAGVIVVTEEEPVEMALLFSPYFIAPREWLAHGRIPRAKLYVATYFETAAYAFAAKNAHPSARLAYMVQGYEGWFPNADLETVAATYAAIPTRIVVSKWLQTMLERWDCSSTHISNGVDAKFFYPAVVREAVAGEANPTLFTMLRRDPQGGWKLAFNVIRRLKTLRPELRIIAVGDLVTDPEIAPYLDERYLGVNRREMALLYRRSDIFLDSSMVQGFGLMGLEAMASGLAVVITNSGGVLDYADSSNALLCELGDEEGILQSVLELVDNPSSREKLAIAGRARAEEFDWERRIDAYRDFIAKAITTDGPADTASEKAMLSFLLRQFFRSRGLQADILQAQAQLVDELQISSPRSAEQVVSASRPEFAEMFRSTAEGASLAAVYENARNAVNREGGLRPELAGPGTLLSRVRTLVPPTV